MPVVSKSHPGEGTRLAQEGLALSSLDACPTHTALLLGCAHTRGIAFETSENTKGSKGSDFQGWQDGLPSGGHWESVSDGMIPVATCDGGLL